MYDSMLIVQYRRLRGSSMDVKWWAPFMAVCVGLGITLLVLLMQSCGDATVINKYQPTCVVGHDEYQDRCLNHSSIYPFCRHRIKMRVHVCDQWQTSS